MTGRVYTARAELTLARPDAYPLRTVPLTPDPLTGLARVFAGLREDLGESIELAIDLLPVGPLERRRLRRRAARSRHAGRAVAATAAQETFGSTLVQVLNAPPGSTPPRPTRPTGRSAGPAGDIAALEARDLGRRVATKLLTLEATFHLQMLLRVRSQVPGRPQVHLQAVLGALEAFAGDNRFRVVGTGLGVAHLGADLPGVRAWFDRRMDRGVFAPRGRRHGRLGPVVTAGEIAGLLKPPTASCDAENVLRSGGAIPAPPRDLPTYTGQPDLLPLGQVRDVDGWRPAGVPLADTLFALQSGRAGFGKSTTLITQFVALASHGHGGLVLDPHDAVARIKPYLTGQADRVMEIELRPGRRELRQAGWNPLSMWRYTPAGPRRRPATEIEARVNCVVDSFAAALRWNEINNRALTFTTMSAQALCELGMQLPPHLQPTLFQMSTILSDPDWRECVIDHLSPTTADFFATRFTKISDETTPVTNLLDRLRSAPSVAALLGSSQSTFDLRTAMDAGQLVLLSTGQGQRARLVNAFFVYDLLQAALSREDVPEADRRLFWAFVDELPAVDSPNFAALLEQTRKFGLRMFAYTQQPERLTQTTLQALLTNRSHLVSNALGAESAKRLVAEWGGRVGKEVLVELERYHALASITLNGRITPPFLVKGFDDTVLHADLRDPDGVDELDARIDANTGRRPAEEVLAELASLDQRILEALSTRDTTPRPARPGNGTRPATRSRRGTGAAGTRLDPAPASDSSPAGHTAAAEPSAGAGESGDPTVVDLHAARQRKNSDRRGFTRG